MLYLPELVFGGFRCRSKTVENSIIIWFFKPRPSARLRNGMYTDFKKYSINKCCCVRWHHVYGGVSGKTRRCHFPPAVHPAPSTRPATGTPPASRLFCCSPARFIFEVTFTSHAHALLMSSFSFLAAHCIVVSFTSLCAEQIFIQ
jgi:hypothetical protein